MPRASATDLVLRGRQDAVGLQGAVGLREVSESGACSAPRILRPDLIPGVHPEPEDFEMFQPPRQQWMRHAYRTGLARQRTVGAAASGTGRNPTRELEWHQPLSGPLRAAHGIRRGAGPVGPRARTPGADR
ncbi:MAG: hypothetical protein AAF317_15705 [Pseudomonadota bacterium]